MKSLLKLALVVFLFTTNIFAEEGNMGNGGRTCPNGTTTCLVYSEAPQNEETTTESDAILDTAQEYWNLLLQYFAN